MLHPKLQSAPDFTKPAWFQRKPLKMGIQFASIFSPTKELCDGSSPYIPKIGIYVQQLISYNEKAINFVRKKLF